MGQILVRNLDNGVIERLKIRAAKDKQSLEQAVRDILTSSVHMTKVDAIAEMARIRASTKPSAVSSVDLIRAFRDGDDPDA